MRDWGERKRRWHGGDSLVDAVRQGRVQGLEMVVRRRRNIRGLGDCLLCEICLTTVLRFILFCWSFVFSGLILHGLFELKICPPSFTDYIEIASEDH